MSKSKLGPAFNESIGINAQEYAAIRLRVPMSNTPWLDEMIEASRRDEFAKHMAQASVMVDVGRDIDDDRIAQWAYTTADALLAASNKRKEGE
jgi:hypothetical protein